MHTTAIDLLMIARLQKQKRKFIRSADVRLFRDHLVQALEKCGKPTRDFVPAKFAEDHSNEAYSVACHLAGTLAYEAFVKDGVVKFKWDPKLLTHRLILVRMLRGPGYVSLTPKQEEIIASDIIDLLHRLHGTLIEEDLKGGVSDDTRHKAGAFAEMIIEEMTCFYMPLYAKISKMALEVLSYLCPVPGSLGKVPKYGASRLHRPVTQPQTMRVQPIKPTLKVWEDMKQQYLTAAANQYKVDLKKKAD